MGRKSLSIDVEKLKARINELENTQEFENQSKLFAVLGTEFNVLPINIYNRVREHSIELKTPKGKRGISKGVVIDKTPTAANIKNKEATFLIYAEALRKEFSEAEGALAKKVDKAIAGSLKSAIALKCIECCGGERTEVAHCEITGCPLWAYRPYKAKLGENDEIGEAEEEESTNESDTL